MKFSKRILAIADFVKSGSNLIDVGADHGLLEHCLLKQKKTKSLLAIENKQGPFLRLKESCQNIDVDVLLSDGLDDVTNFKNYDTLVLAGLGGLTIIDILKKAKDKLGTFKNIIVDPHKDIELVRRYLVSIGYKIEMEKIVFELKQYYFIISFIKGDGSYSDDEYCLGYNTDKDPLFQDYLSFLKSKLLRARKQILTNTDNADSKELDEQIERIKKYEHH